MVHSACSSVTINGVLPSAKHFLVGLFFISNTFLVFDLGKFGGSLVVHLSLEVSADLSVTLTDLSEDVSLVGLLVHSLHSSLSHEGLVLAGDLGFDDSFLVCLVPELLSLKFLLEFDVSLTVLVNVLEEVNAGLVFTAPLLLTSIPLLCVVCGDEVLNHLLVSSLVGLSFLVEFLELHNFFTSGESLSFFKVLNGFLTLESGSEHVLITSLFLLKSGLSQSELTFVVLDQILVALSVESETLSLHVGLGGSFGLPLSLKHRAFLSSQFVFLLALDFSSVSLPVTDSHSVGN